jgi:transcriptional regulator with XRE-family HTH domain
MGSGFRPKLADALQILRIASQKDQKEVALHTGIPVNSLSLYERGKMEPPPERVRLLLSEMGFTAEDLEDAETFLERRRARLAVPGPIPGEERDAVRHRLQRVAKEIGQAVERLALWAFDLWLDEARVAEKRQAAPGFWRRLKGYAFPDQKAVVETNPELRNFALVERVCRESREAAPNSADEAVALGRLAVFLAEQVEERGTLREQTLALAWAHLANSLRVKGKLSEAREAFQKADGFWDFAADEGGGVIAAAQVLSLKASLRRAERKFPEALILIDRAIELREEWQRPELIVKKATVQIDACAYEDAITTLGEVLPRLDTSCPTRLEFAARIGLLKSLTFAMRFAEAKAILPQVRRLVSLGNRLDQLRLRWSEATLAAMSGQLEEGIALLEEVRRHIEALGIPYDTALATLELAVYLFCNEETRLGSRDSPTS